MNSSSVNRNFKEVSDFDDKMGNEKVIVKTNKRITTLSDSGVVISDDLSSNKENKKDSMPKWLNDNLPI